MRKIEEMMMNRNKMMKKRKKMGKVQVNLTTHDVG